MKWFSVRKLEGHGNSSGIALCSGKPDSEYRDASKRCHLDVRAWDRCLTVLLPPIIKPQETRHVANWDTETIARLGRDYWSEWDEREYGVQFTDDAMHLRFGAQTFDSLTDHSKCVFQPWLCKRFHRFSLYDLDGRHFWSKFERETNKQRKVWRKAGATGWFDQFAEQSTQEAECPKITFAFTDYDDELIFVRCHIEEREWRHGTGWFAWLSLFCKPLVRRCLSLAFDREVGQRKGSWKGGTLGHAVEMLPSDSPEWAFRRYCAAHDLKFLGRAGNEKWRENVRVTDAGDQPKAAVPV